MDKSVTPYLSDSHVINEWRYLSGIMSGDPIDFGQIDFYLLMANKNQGNSSTVSNISMNKSSNNSGNLGDQDNYGRLGNN